MTELLDDYLETKQISPETAKNYRIRLNRSGWVDKALFEINDRNLCAKQREIAESFHELGRSEVYTVQTCKMLRCLAEYGRELGLVKVSARRIRKGPIPEGGRKEGPAIPELSLPRIIPAKAISSLTFGDLFKIYISHHIQPHGKRSNDIERAYEYYLSHWKDRKAADLTRFDIQSLHARLGAEHGRTTANRTVQLIRSIFYRAINFEIFDGLNPARNVKMFRLQSRDRFLDKEEVDRLLAALQTLKSETTKDFLLLCLFTGARRTNVAGMQWCDVNLQLKLWTIPKTKNGTSQRLPLTCYALDVLERRKASAYNKFVFPSDRSASGHLTKPEEAWKQLRQRAGMENIRMHDLRRTLASWQAMTGANLSVIAATLNHKDFKSVGIYARLQIDPVRDAIESATKAMLGSRDSI